MFKPHHLCLLFCLTAKLNVLIEVYCSTRVLYSAKVCQGETLMNESFTKQSFDELIVGLKGEILRDKGL